MSRTLIDVERLEERNAPTSVFDFKEWISQFLREIKITINTVVTTRIEQQTIKSAKITVQEVKKESRLQNIKFHEKSLEEFFITLDPKFSVSLGIGVHVLDNYFLLAGRLVEVEGVGIVAVV